MNIRRRTLLGSLLAVPVVGALAACGDDTATGGSTGEVTKINYGYIPDYAGASLLAIANDQKLWEKHGLEANLQSFTNGPLQIQALGTGDLDFGYIGPGAMWLPASGKAKVLTVNGVGKADRVIAQAGITSVADLKGKKVAIPEGTSGDMIVQLALKEAGLTMDDIEKVAMDPATVVSAFASKQVDAAGIWYPLIDTIKQQAPDLVELAKNDDFEKVMQFPNVMVTSNDSVEKNKDAAIKVTKVLRDAMDFRADNVEKTVELTAAFPQGEVEALKNDANNAKYYRAAELDAITEDGTVETWLGAMSDFFAENGKIEGEAVKASDFYLGDVFVEAGK